MQRKQSGFTLIEISIVMAIISLLITLTIKGRELVESSRAKSIASDFRGIQTALYGYQDRFRALPGDDSNASAHLKGSPTVINNGNGNLHIEGQLNAAWGESYFLWQHIRLAGFLQGAIDPAATGYVPISAAGGAFGVTDISNAPITGMSGGYIICSDNISGRLVKQLDMMLDDGYTAKGAMLVSHANTGGEPIPSSSIIDNNSYLACLTS
ncbi:MAG: type II secretion system GspH family protein [Gammaproteobacteria bacterium]|nr:type II secretion system GspH family protein [Gammaproteobacteria bacterium]MBU1624870.1 type II secretion system GspH family protein [Gammaproteobacteria bacterium]MBU1982714.1 type II secretion system GspH family protein [Gammaproteobacteria bacterium]